MGLSHDASQEWQLLASVHPVFASILPSVDGPDKNENSRETLLNLQTLYEFEIWLIPDALQEALILRRTRCISAEGITALTGLLQLFENSINDGLLQFCHETEKTFPRLRALQHELNRRHERTSGGISELSQDLSGLIGPRFTLEGLRSIVTALENFNRTVSRASSSTKEDDSGHDVTHSWREDEVQAVFEAGQVRKNMDAVFDTFVEQLRNCDPPHTAMFHLTDSRSLKMLLSSCSNQHVWRHIACVITSDQTDFSHPEWPRSTTLQNNLCAAIRGPPHKLVQAVFNDSLVWNTSDETVPIIRDRSRVPLLQLLEGRTRGTPTFSTTSFLSKKKKKIIAVILANFLMKLLGGRWLQHLWNAENIFFLSDFNTGEVHGLDVPYILSSLTASPDETMDVDFKLYYPFIYAFGVLILELELDQSISITTEDKDGADEEYPAIYMALVRIFQLRKEDLDDPYILQIINSCLDFVHRVESIQHKSFNEEHRFNAAVLRYIIEPLVQRVRVAHPDVSLDLLGISVRSFETKLTPPPSKSNALFSSTHFGQDATSVHLDERVVSPSKVAESSRKRTSSSMAPTAHPNQPRHRREFKIVIICALPVEADAVIAVFDKRWDDHGNPFGKAPGDPNAYSTGRIGRHNVVLVHMPGIGKENAASAAANCRSSFGSIELAIVVGICAGVPFPKQGEEILLGDVVISEGIISYDFGRQYPDKLIRKTTVLDSYGRPNPEIRALLARLKVRQERKSFQDKLSVYLSNFPRELGTLTAYPGRDRDILFGSSYRHKHQNSLDCTVCAACSHKSDPVCEAALNSTCEELGCDSWRPVHRQRLGQATAIDGDLHQPWVHFGLVASGDVVMKSGEDRDEIAAKENVIAFEMEGAGVWDNFPCLIIKGVCDYADSHKSKKWQNYAAATAAACMKALLDNWVSSSSASWN